jgi:putative ABC transport system permease protein
MLRRGLWSHRGQVVTIALVIASGVAIFVASLSAYQSLVRSKAAFYAESRFADVFAGVRRAPDGLVARIRAIDGVAAAETRVVAQSVIELEGRGVPLSGRLVGLPRDGPPQLNRLTILAGRAPIPGSTREALVGAGFAEANGLGPGDTFSARLNGRLTRYTITGIAVSPEFVFAAPPGDPLPDDRRFGVFWVDGQSLAGAYDLEGAFNDVTVRLAPGARPAAVMDDLDRLLAPDGGLVSHDSGQQVSDRFLTDEIAQQGTMAATIPPVFLVVAAFLLNAVIGRLVVTEREQIAALKALGYTNREVGAHYLAFVGAVAGLGVAAGLVLGVVFGKLMLTSYQPFFRFPSLDYALEPWVPATAAAVAFSACIAAAAGALRSIVRLGPAEAMRAPAPRAFRRLPGERFFFGRGPARWTMVWRDAVARPVRTLLTLAGVVLSVPLIVMSLFWNDAIDLMIDVQFTAAERADAVLTFTDPAPPRILRAVERMPGVLVAESQRTVPVLLRHGRATYRTAVSGIAPDATLRRLLDRSLRPVALPETGLLLSRRLAERLSLRVGDDVDVEVLDGRRPRRTLPVAGLVDDLIGLSAYMDDGALARLMGDGGRVTAAAVRLDPAARDAFYGAVLASPKVSGLGIRGATIENFRRTTGTVVLLVAGVFALFAVTIAFGVVYNGMRISFHERSRELATLRILGYTRAELLRITFAETATELSLGIPLGLVLGGWWVAALVLTFETEMFRIPAEVSPSSYGWAAVVVLAAGVMSMLAVGRRVLQLDLVGVLKARD